MKKVYNFLVLLIGSFIGYFLGSTGYTIWHYKTYPELYAMQSAPWYLKIEIQAAFTAVVVLVLLILRRVIRKKLGITTHLA